MAEEARLLGALGALLRAIGALDGHLEGMAAVATAATERLHQVNAETEAAIEAAVATRRNQLLCLQRRAAREVRLRLQQIKEQVRTSYRRARMIRS